LLTLIVYVMQLALILLNVLHSGVLLSGAEVQLLAP
jgi:hypothetical protein